MTKYCKAVLIVSHMFLPHQGSFQMPNASPATPPRFKDGFACGEAIHTHTDTLAHIAIALHFYWVDSIFLLVETTCFYSQFPVFLVGMLFRDGDISMAIG